MSFSFISMRLDEILMQHFGGEFTIGVKHSGMSNEIPIAIYGIEENIFKTVHQELLNPPNYEQINNTNDQ